MLTRVLGLGVVGVASALLMLTANVEKALVAGTRPEDRYDAVIIGAGWAGINAARELKASGVSMIILEANDYIGGRSKSINSDGTLNAPPAELPSNNVPMDMGSEYLYTANELKNYLRRNGFLENIDLDDAEDSPPHVLSGDRSIGYFRQERYIDGTTRTIGLIPNDLRSMYSAMWRPFVEYIQELYQSEGEMSYADALERYTAARQISNTDRQYLNLMLDAGLEIEYGGESGRMSIWYHDLGAILNNDSPIHLMSKIGVGYGNTAAAVAESNDLPIQLNSKVTRHEGEVATVRAKVVSVTVSLGVLKSNIIEFTPDLPAQKKDAIENMEVGIFNKCAMTWNDRGALVWPEEQLAFELITPTDETSGRWTTFNNPTLYKGGKPTLVGWIAGDEAVRMESQSDEEVLDEVMVNLEAMFPDITRPDEVHITRWGSDPSFMGSYAHMAIGRDHEQDAMNLGARVGRISFAGEATDATWYGTTVGPWKSGGRVAEEMMAILAVEVPTPSPSFSPTELNTGTPSKSPTVSLSEAPSMTPSDVDVNENVVEPVNEVLVSNDPVETNLPAPEQADTDGENSSTAISVSILVFLIIAFIN
ncbi:hypothetical protein THAOC_07161 [Thalassiosira oceanica]|uniref:Amine oxidase domain-containing protein n=1 Tax=Thalassiosira oceanica TaxID=159749 RepID=K0T0Z4_THAOC|nr:hypothetical protein THAOC_07161 [Thalassiosira oceanica]|eukprot:EJK71405.1 hypothetical protein THAOC_07161 [Thalassiosira oceanica]